MKSFFLSLATTLAASTSFSATYPLYFHWCSSNDFYVCATIDGREYSVASPFEDVNRAIAESIMDVNGRSLAMNVEGEIFELKPDMYGNRIFQLQVYNLQGDPNAPKPRSAPRF